MSPGKRADKATQLDVEKLTFDFLVHDASKGIFEEYRRSKTKSKESVTTDGEFSDKQIERLQYWSTVFKRNFPHERLGAQASLRMKLLHLTLLISQRTIPTLPEESRGALQATCSIMESIQTSNGQKSSHLSASSSSSSHTCPLSRNHLNQLPASPEYRLHYLELLRRSGATEIEPALLSLQKLFFKLSAYRNQLTGSSPALKRDWMNLAGQFMLQCAIEEMLVHGTDDPELLTRAFAWRWKGDNPSDEVEWERNKACWIALLKPKKSTPLVCHLLEIAAKYPLYQFETQMMAFLESLHHQITPPVLEQLNQGQFDGLSVGQNQTMMSRARVVL